MRHNFYLLAVSILFLTSCYSTYSTYKGNEHQKAIGKTKNEILRIYGVPDKTTDDGEGGTILIYEKYTQTTVTNVGSASYGRARGYGAAIYGSSGMLSASEGEAGAVSATRGISQTSMDKTFCYLFLNKNNVVYDFKSNYGALYNYGRCFDKTLTWGTVIGTGIGGLFIPLVVTVPWAIIAQKKAKKRGELCN